MVGEAEDGQSAITLIRKGVDVLLLDLAMPGRAGLSLLRQVLDEAPELRVIVFTAYDPVSHKDRALALGASGYVARIRAPPNSRCHPPIDAAAGAKRVASNEGEPHTQLSLRRYDIFIRLVRGESVTDIAKDLHLSVKTVSTHKVTVQKRLGAQWLIWCDTPCSINW